MTLRSLVFSLLLATTVEATTFPLVFDEHASNAHVALTRSGAAFLWSTPQGLRVAVTDTRGTLSPDQRLLSGMDGAVASDGQHALFVWNDNGVIKASLMPGPETQQVLGENAGTATPAVVWNDTRYVVVWSHLSNALVARTVDANGSPEPGTHVVAPGGADVPRHIALASAGGEMLVAWDRYAYDIARNTVATRVEEQRLTDDGRTIEGTRQISPTGSAPALASNGHEYFLVWNETSQLSGTIVALDGSPGATRTVASGSNARLAWNGAHYALVWTTFIVNRPQINYAFLSPDGALITSPVFIVGDTREYEYDVSARPETGEMAIVAGRSLRFLDVIHLLYVDPVRARPARRF